MLNDKHIKVDLGFLDKDFKENPTQKPSSATTPTPISTKSTSSQGGNPLLNHSDDELKKVASAAQADIPRLRKKKALKMFLWGIGILIFLAIIASASGDNTSAPAQNYVTPSTVTPNYVTPLTNTSDGSVQVGHYMCSSYAASQADSMAPSALEKSQVDNEEIEVQNETTARKAEKASLSSESVDQTDQAAIDSYNAKVDAFNNSYQAYSDRYDTYERDLASYNQKVDAYNNYLSANCTPN